MLMQGDVNTEHNQEVSSPSDTKSLNEQVGRFEEHLVRNAMTECKGCIKDVMALLQISRRNLNLKMQRYNINRSDYIND